MAVVSADRVAEACRSRAAAIAESLNLCFDAAWELEVGEPAPYAEADWPAELDDAGLAVVIETADFHLLALVPEGLPLPAWYLTPNKSQSARMQTLALEWSLSLLPDDLEAGAWRSVAVDNLRDATGDAGPTRDAACLDFSLTDKNGLPSWCRLVWPVSNPAAVTPADIAEPSTASAAPDHAEPPTAPEPLRGPLRHVPTRQLLRLPVTVSVRLAERRIELKQLLGLSPGALLTFNKSCEDLLDLYVNNRLYCRGEAVKIGEKFGLKISTFESKPER